MTRNTLFIISLIIFMAMGGFNLHAQKQTSSNANTTSGTITSGSGYHEDWDPMEEMKRVQDRMEKLYRNIMGDQMATFPRRGGGGALGSITHSPDLDMTETPKYYRLDLDLPGMEKDQIDISVKDKIMTISGERKREDVKEEKSDESSYYYRGRSFGAFHHALELPENADEDNISADYKNGVLTVTVPKLSKIPDTPAKKIKVA